jgi:hypothetical protein
MAKYGLLCAGVVICAVDAFIPQVTVLSWIGFACAFVALGIIWRERG